MRGGRLTPDETMVKKATTALDCEPHEMVFYSWPCLFGDTAGPRKGGIAGRAMTDYQVFVFEHHYTKQAIAFCGNEQKMIADFKYGDHWDRLKEIGGNDGNGK